MRKAFRRARALIGITMGAGLAGCVGSPPPEPIVMRRRADPPPLPDTTGRGVHVLTLAQSPGRQGALWAGTYGRGLFVLRDTEGEAPLRWENYTARADDPISISWNYVNSVGVTRDGTVWYGTVGNGFGRSNDGGLTWRNWSIEQLGPQWQYVAHEGIRTRGDTVYIATGDGLRISSDSGETWRCIHGQAGPEDGANDECDERIRSLPTSYLLSLGLARRGRIWVGHLFGLSYSDDDGQTWQHVTEEQGIPRTRIRAVTVNTDSTVWAASETAVYVDSAGDGTFRQAEVRVPGFQRLPGSPRSLIPSPGGGMPPLIALSYGMAAPEVGGTWRLHYLPAADAYRPAGDMWSVLWWGVVDVWPIGAAATGLNIALAGTRPDRAMMAQPGSPPEEPRHPWLGRPIADADGNPYVDPTYPYGGTMGGSFLPNPGVELNNPPGTPIRAIAPGTVVYAGVGEDGSNAVAVRHDRQQDGQFVFSTYHDAASIEVSTGQRVNGGDVVGRVGNTGRSANNHLHVEVHVAPTQDTSQVVATGRPFPPFAVNPQLWMQPRPGTGVVVGRVVDSQGAPIPGARVHGLVLAYPTETPFSFVETYGANARSDPAYEENFAVGDVPAGEYSLGVDIEGTRIWRRIRVTEGRVTLVVFSP